MIKEYFFSQGKNKYVYSGAFLLAVIFMLGLNLADIYIPHFSIRHQLLNPWVSDIIIATLLVETVGITRIIADNTISIRQKYFLMCFFILSGFVLVNICSRGLLMEGLFFEDINDTFMDFFKSVLDSTHPYDRGVIYPPLINTFYLVIKQLVDTTGNFYSVASSQTGKIVFLLYVLITNVIFVYLLNKYKAGTLKERIAFFLTVILGIPYLYCMERGNSVFICMLLLLFFFFSYKDKSIKMRRYAYCALGGAVGIKIVPAIFLMLVFRQNGRKEFITAVKIAALFFFVPFIVTQGTPVKLLNNIQYTTSLFQGFEITEGNEWVLLGQGDCVNIVSFFNALRRLFNVDFIIFARALNMLVLLAGIIAVALVPKQDEWKIVTILTGVLVACPGFSYIYNLLYFLPSLLLFIDSQPKNTKLNMVYLLSFLCIFMPWFNIENSIFDVFSHDRSHMRWSTVFESIAIIILLITLEIETLAVVIKTPKKNKFCRDYKYAIPATACLIIWGYAINAIGPVYVDKFYPFAMNAGSSVKGITMLDGQYRCLSNTGDIYLQSAPLLRNGLLISFSQKRDKQDRQEQMVEVFVNGKLLSRKMLDICDDYIYAEPSQLAGILSEEKALITLKCESDMDGGNPLEIEYAGPLDGGVCMNGLSADNYYEVSGKIYRMRERKLQAGARTIDNKLFPAYNTKGFEMRGHYCRLANDIKEPWCIGKMASLLLDCSYYRDGVEFSFFVPEHIIDKKNGSVLQISIDSEIKKTINLSRGGGYNVVLSPEDLGISEKDERRVIELQLLAKNIVLDEKSEFLREGICIDYLGPCVNRSFFSDINTYHNISGHYNAKDLAQCGFYIICANDDGYQTQKLSVLVNGKNVQGEEIFRSDKIAITYIEPSKFVNYQGMLSLDVQLGQTPHEYGGEKGILYAGLGSGDNIFDNGTKEKGSLLTYGLVPGKSGISMESYSLIVLPREWLKGDIDIECNTKAELFWEMRGKDVNMFAVINGKYLGKCNLSKGENHLIIPQEKYEGNERFVFVELYGTKASSKPVLEGVTIKKDKLFYKIKRNDTYFQWEVSER